MRRVILDMIKIIIGSYVMMHFFFRLCDEQGGIGRKIKLGKFMKKVAFLLPSHADEAYAVDWLITAFLSICFRIQIFLASFLIFMNDSDWMKLCVEYMAVLFILSVGIVMIYTLLIVVIQIHKEIMKWSQERNELIIKDKCQYKNKLIKEIRYVKSKAMDCKARIILLPSDLGVGTDGYLRRNDLYNTRLAYDSHGESYEICVGDYTAMAVLFAKKGYQVVTLQLNEKNKGGIDELGDEIHSFVKRLPGKEEKIIFFGHGFPGIFWALALADKYKTAGLILAGGNLRGYLETKNCYETNLSTTCGSEDGVKLYTDVTEFTWETIKKISNDYSMPFLRIIPEKTPYMYRGKGKDDVCDLDNGKIETQVIPMQEYFINCESCPDFYCTVHERKKLGVDNHMINTILGWLDKNYG